MPIFHQIAGVNGWFVSMIAEQATYTNNWTVSSPYNIKGLVHRTSWRREKGNRVFNNSKSFFPTELRALGSVTVFCQKFHLVFGLGLLLLLSCVPYHPMRLKWRELDLHRKEEEEAENLCLTPWSQLWSKFFWHRSPFVCMHPYMGKGQKVYILDLFSLIFLHFPNLKPNLRAILGQFAAI